MKPLSTPVVVLLLAGAITSCSNQPAPPATLCGDARPEVCTMIYAPVCAVTADGERNTFRSGCNACSWEEVIGYDDGECQPSG